jgi:hypothetical protein
VWRLLISTQISNSPHTGAIAIDPRGAVVGPVERAFMSTPSTPARSFRDRYSVSGAKDDGATFVWADSLRTDQPCFRRVRLTSAGDQLRNSRADEDRNEAQSAGRLREQLLLLACASVADEPRLWTPLELAPSPSATQRLRPACRWPAACTPRTPPSADDVVPLRAPAARLRLA